jgi:multiple antibiotic resistance protein
LTVLKEAIAKLTSGESLGRDESKRVVGEILAGEGDDAQIAALLVALKMLVGAGGEEEAHEQANERAAESIALYPLAVPYLLNPAGITLLVIFSGALDSWLMLGVMVLLVLLMAAFDRFVFGHMDAIARHLDKARLAVTEAVFGVLLAALAVQLVLQGLADLHIIEPLTH